MSSHQQTFLSVGENFETLYIQKDLPQKDTAGEVKRRHQLAWVKFGKLCFIFCDQDIPDKVLRAQLGIPEDFLNNHYNTSDNSLILLTILAVCINPVQKFDAALQQFFPGFNYQALVMSIDPIAHVPSSFTTCPFL